MRGGRGGIVPPPEHRWRPGQSGNPGGKPRTKHISNAMRRIGRIPVERLPEVQPATVDEATALRVRAKLLEDPTACRGDLLRQVLDRVEGPVLRDDASGVAPIGNLNVTVNFGPRGVDVRVLPESEPEPE